jgi:hypothetical protein
MSGNPEEFVAEVMAQRAEASLEAQGHTGAKKRDVDEQCAGHEQARGGRNWAKRTPNKLALDIMKLRPQ